MSESFVSLNNLTLAYEIQLLPLNLDIQRENFSPSWAFWMRQNHYDEPSGAVTPRSGTIVIDGTDVTKVPNKRGVGLVFPSTLCFPIFQPLKMAFGLRLEKSRMVRSSDVWVKVLIPSNLVNSLIEKRANSPVASNKGYPWLDLAEPRLLLDEHYRTWMRLRLECGLLQRLQRNEPPVFVTQPSGGTDWQNSLMRTGRTNGHSADFQYLLLCLLRFMSFENIFEVPMEN